MLQNLSDRLQSRLGVLPLTAVAALIFAGSVFGFVNAPDSNPKVGTSSTTSSTVVGTSTSAPSTTSTQLRKLEGFDEMALNVTTSTGEKKKVCVAVAASTDQQAKGMMNVDNFGGYDGMLFPFDADTTAGFFTANVRFPLSIAFFDATGAFINSHDMPPCKTAAAQCPIYRANKAFRVALETGEGGLGSLGIGNGANVAPGGTCT